MSQIISEPPMIELIRLHHGAAASGTSTQMDALSPISDISLSPGTAHAYPPDVSASRSSTQGIAVSALIMSVILISVFIVGALLIIREIRRRSHGQNQIRRNAGGQRRSAHPNDDMELSSRHLGLRKFSYKELKLATQNFDNSQLLGSGGYGCVFKGTLQGQNLHESSMFGCGAPCTCGSEERGESPASRRHQIVAVKRISIEKTEAIRGFKAELTIISDLRHRNLVRLRGWGEGKGWLFLIYDYMLNGSLDGVLYNDFECIALNWARRFNICLDLGAALLYLHEEVDQVVLHRDIKSSNVLLDENFNAKLGDFGLSRLLQPLMSGHDSMLVAGTRGYMALEIFGTGRTTKQSDVFAFGAVLAELATGRRPLDRRVQQHYDEAVRHVDWMWDLHSQDKLTEAADERLEGNFDLTQMRRVMMVALACSHPDPKLRPCVRNALDAMLGTGPLPSIPPMKPPLSPNILNMAQGFTTSISSVAAKDDTHSQHLSNDRQRQAYASAEIQFEASNTSLPAMNVSKSSYHTARYNSPMVSLMNKVIGGPSVRLRRLFVRGLGNS
ncbi:hypothetical protein L7F22_000245 [Adiantum nelumboides]|nr:hypothetical protein [Adiantum nelumboides]